MVGHVGRLQLLPMKAGESTTAAEQSTRESGLRYVVESLISLALAVMLVRSFAVEGYIISTGSMAPYLLGYHKQVVCPNCRCPFAVGVPVETEYATSGPVACPNCQQDQIDLGKVPRNEGDQLLVQKFAYLLRHPRRWEVVVFQNPSHPTQAYVKRAIGLPNESLQIVGGDIWINGELVRKDLDEQRSTRIPFETQRHFSQSDKASRWHNDTGWQMRSNGLELPKESESWAWVKYQRERVPDHSSSTTTAVAWPTDEYGYNGLTDPTQTHRVRDLMLSAEVELHTGRGDFAISLTDGLQVFEARLAAGQRELQLFLDGQKTPAAKTDLDGSVWRRPIRLELSTFDRQLLFAVDGETIFVQKLPPRANQVGDPGLAANDGTPVRFGARDLHVSVRDLTLFRDVYYTRGDARHGVTEPCQLGPDEYFFLGDNSPVSLDSRSWPEAVVHRNSLIGKPFMVHLPSRPGRIKLGSAEWHIRVPDWGRIRYIR